LLLGSFLVLNRHTVCLLLRYILRSSQCLFLNNHYVYGVTIYRYSKTSYLVALFLFPELFGEALPSPLVPFLPSSNFYDILLFLLIANCSFAMPSNQFDHGPDLVPLQATSEEMNASELPASTSRTGRSQLGVDFQPSDSSVICGRGKASYDHAGNHRLRLLANKFVKDYSQASRKLEKSAIVANIVAVIRQGGGRFCKREKGEWFEVGDYYAREKVSALFRDKLHTRYLSSSKVKIARRRARSKRTETQAQHYGQQLVDDTGYSDDSSISSYSLGCSTDSLGFDHSLEIDFFDIDVF
jgi:hypothetical protein